MIPAVLTRESALAVRDDVASRLDRGERRIELDLSGVDRADSFGVAALLESYELTKDRGGELVISHVSEELSELFAFF
ncbi:MAG: STAS domain-containing protein, partial [Planctomycetota bacterium]